MAVAIAVVTFWLGVFSVLVAEAVLVYIWFVSKKVVKPPVIVEKKPTLPQALLVSPKGNYTRIYARSFTPELVNTNKELSQRVEEGDNYLTTFCQLATGKICKISQSSTDSNVVEEIARCISQDGSNAKETCQFLNVGLSFLFQELKDSLVVKRFIMRRIQKEFEDFMMTKTQGKLVEQLTVRNYCLGKQLPVFHSAQVTDLKRNGSLIENIDINLDVEYEGEAHICIDANLILGKCAFVSVKICRVKGQGRLQFTRHPYTNWSFSFYETPDLQVEVECLLDGRQFSQLSGFIESQIHKWVKKKHTLPNYKPRFVPFFPQPIPHDQRVEMYLYDKKLTVGQLMVEVIECSHLSPVQCPAQLFCSLQLGEGPNQPLTGMWRMLWPVMECSVNRPADGEPIGAIFVETSWREKEEEKHELVVVQSVKANSPASNAGICKGDVVYSINHMKVTNAKSVVKLLHKISTERFLFTMMRPPVYAQSALLSRAQKKQRKHNTTTDGAEMSVQDSDKLSTASNVKKKKNRLRHEDKQLPTFERMDPNLPSEYVADTSSKHNSEIKLRRQAASLDYSRSLDDGYISHKDHLTHSTSTISSQSVVIDHVDPPLTTSNSPMDCVDSVLTDQQLTSDHGSYTTSRKPACQNPCWDEKFIFSVLPNDQYLNIVLWCQLEEEKDYAVAHVSISLVDIAVQCLSNSSCTHTQRYVMLPNEPTKFGSSRSVIKLTGSRGNILYEGVHGGDILLRLTHYTEQRTPPEVDTNVTAEQVDLSDHQGASDCSDEEAMFSGEHVLLQNEPAEKLKTDHNFQPTEIKNVPAHCEICKKKFWRHRVLQCIHCDLFCHKKCTLYCKMQVPCYRKTSGYHIEKHNERSMSLELDREVAEDDNTSSKMEGHNLQHSISLRLDRDLVEDDTLSEHDFEHSISSELRADLNFFSGSETESEGEFFEYSSPVQHKIVSKEFPQSSEQVQHKEQIQHRLGVILAEMHSIKGTYNELGKTKPANDEEAKSINATQENLTIKLDSLKQEMLQCYEELNR